MDLPKLRVKPGTFLTDALLVLEQQQLAVTEHRRQFVTDSLSKVAALNQEVIDRDLRSLVATEIQAGVEGMQQWMNAKIRMTEVKLRKIEKEADKSFFGEENLELVERVRSEMEWLRTRIAELENRIEKRMRWKRELELKNEANAQSVDRLQRHLKHILAENLALHSQVDIPDPFPALQSTIPKRVSMTPEPALLTQSIPHSVLRLKKTMQEAQRSVSAMKVRVREVRSRSPAMKPRVSELERFFRRSLALYTRKASMSPEKRQVSPLSTIKPLLRSKSSTRVPTSTALPKSASAKEVSAAQLLHRVASNPTFTEVLAVFTFRRRLC